MWPFSGSEHYGTDGPDARWRSSYARASRFASDSCFDIDRWTYLRKEASFDAIGDSIVVVSASRWMMDCARESSLMRSWNHTLIPHTVNTHQFKPIDRAEARQHVEVDLEASIVLFLSSAGIDDTRKGWTYLRDAFDILAIERPKTELIVVGPKPPANKQLLISESSPIRITWLDSVTSDEYLNILYNAADTTTVPSTFDNLPLVAMEAQSAGCPVSCFGIRGTRDIIMNGITGFFAESESPESLARAIISSMDPRLRRTAREFATSTWSPTQIVGRYSEEYRRLLT